jgi:hypothetical protein
MTSQATAILLMVASLMAAGGVSLAFGSLRPGRREPREPVVPLDADGNPTLSNSPRFSPLHY